MSKTSIHVEAKTIELALIKAKSELGVPQEKISYRVLRQTAGIASLFSGRKVELEVWRKQDGQPNVDALQEELTEYCRSLCEYICDRDDVEVSSELQEDRLLVNIDDDYLMQAAKKNHRLYEAFEHLLRKKPRHLRTGLPFRIFVDIGNARVERENELVKLARDLANKVVGVNKPLVMNSMTSQERRLVHLALGNDKRIYTKSVGSGFDRKLMILPSKEPQ